VSSAYASGVVARGKVDGGAVVAEASGYLDAAIKASPAKAVELLSEKATMLKDAGRIDDARAALKQAEDEYARQHGTAPASASATPAATGATSAASAPVSVTLTNACKKSASVGNGADAQSVQPSSLAPGVPTTASFAVGDTVWLFDSAGKPIARTKLGAKTKSVKVAKSCRAIVAR